MRSIESSILLVTSKVSNEDLPYSPPPPIFDKRTCIVENRNVFSKIYPAIKTCLSVLELYNTYQFITNLVGSNGGIAYIQLKMSYRESTMTRRLQSLFIYFLSEKKRERDKRCRNSLIFFFDTLICSC
jgi:hypothetical protein